MLSKVHKTYIYTPKVTRNPFAVLEGDNLIASNITIIGLRRIYFGLSVGRYFGINIKLPVLLIFATIYA